VAERIKDDTIESFRNFLVPSNDLFVFMSHSNFDAYLSTVSSDPKVRQDDKDAIIVVVNWLGAFLPTCYYP
jgi:hypothetical protein